MITATGNNFGAGTIQLKDYQSDKMIILNGRVPLDPSQADYEAASQLEIYVPDLMLPKSTTTAVFLHGLSWEKKYVTAVRSWIKNKNTIVLEKPPIFRRASDGPVLDFLCAYVPKGVRFDIQDMQLTTLAIADSTSESAQIHYQQCFITDYNIALKEDINIRAVSLDETAAQASLTYLSTLAVLQLDAILTNAWLVRKVPSKQDSKNQRSFESMLIME